MEAPDQRRGVPSASAIHRIEKCPGSHKASLLHPERGESDDAKAGTRIHLALQHGPQSPEWDDLTSAEEQTAKMCWDQMLSVIGEWSSVEDDNADAEQHLWELAAKEERLGMTVFGKAFQVTPDSTAKFIFTGMADVALMRGNRVILLDYKTGRGETPSSDVNAQLRALAVLASKFMPIDEVTVCVIQPWVGSPKPAVYDKEALEAAGVWLNSVLKAEKSATPDSLNAGEWCEYCSAKVPCPAFRAKVKETVNPLRLDTVPVDKSKEALFARCMEMDAETLLAMMDQRYLLSLAAHSIEGAIRQRVADGDPDVCARYTMKPGAKVRKIIDPCAAFTALQPLGLTLEDLWAAADLSCGPLEASVRMKSGKKLKKDGTESSHYNLSVEEAKERVTTALFNAQAMEYKQNADTLTEIKQLQ